MVPCIAGQVVKIGQGELVESVPKFSLQGLVFDTAIFPKLDNILDKVHFIPCGRVLGEAVLESLAACAVAIIVLGIVHGVC